jgi:molybdopterin converting factor subunit 1
MAPTEKTVRVQLLFFASAQELAGCHRDLLELPAPATVADARQTIARRYPRLSERLGSCRLALNREVTRADAPIPDGSELAVLPPVSGG